MKRPRGAGVTTRSGGAQTSDAQAENMLKLNEIIKNPFIEMQGLGLPMSSNGGI